MKAVLFCHLWHLSCDDIVVATFIWPPATKALGPAPVVNAATRQGLDPWMRVNERYNVPNRERTRKATLEDFLDKPCGQATAPPRATNF